MTAEWTEPRTWVCDEEIWDYLLNEQLRDNTEFLKLNVALEEADGQILSSNAFTKTQSHHVLESETGTTDDLETISGGTEGDVLFLRAKSGHTITIKHGVDNISNPSTNDMDITADIYAALILHDSLWIVIGGNSASDLAAHIAADDHTIYALVDGTRDFTGDVTINKGATATLLVKATNAGQNVWIKADAKDDTAFILYENDVMKGYVKWDAGLGKLIINSAGDLLFDVTGNLDAGTNPIKNVVDPTDDQDADTKNARNAAIATHAALTTSVHNFDASGNAPPQAHASDHTDGTDDIQDATAGQKGLATAAQITKLDGIEALADVTADATITNDTQILAWLGV